MTYGLTALVARLYMIAFTVATWIGDLIEAMTSGFTTLGTAILTFIKTGFMDLFLIYTVDSGTGAITVTGASYFGIFTFVLCGLALTIGITRWISSLCRRKI